jgi:hypothetical protein
VLVEREVGDQTLQPCVFVLELPQAAATCTPTLLQSGGENWARCPVTSALLEVRGGQVAEGTVGPDGIVVHAPGLDDLARVSQAEEPVLVQALVAEQAIETLDVGILIRLARMPRA